VFRALVSLSRWCAQHAWTTIIIVLLLCAGSLLLSAQHLSMNTNTSALFDQSMPYLQAEDAFGKQFPDETDTLLAVIDAPSPTDAATAAEKLAKLLKAQPSLFLSVRQPNGGSFFVDNGLLYLTQGELAEMSTSLAKAQPLLASLSADPSLRGLFKMIELVLDGALRGDAGVEAAAPTIENTAQAINKALAGSPAALDWQGLFASGAANGNRSFVLTRAALDSDAVLQGEPAMNAMRSAIQAAELTPERGYRVRLTGSVALDHEEFGTIETGITLSGLISVVLVAVIVFLALRYGKLVFATLITLSVGLLLTAGWAALSVGELNLISVAFAVMFLGLAVDFGIQFCMRLREQRFQKGNAAEALESSIVITAMPLLLAGIATAIGFFAFLPTSYKGVADLGIIAGGGILIAWLLTITLMPALARLLPPGPESAPAGYQFTRGFNRWLINNRRIVLLIAGVTTLAALALLPKLRFDFDPLNIKDPLSESVSTLRELLDDPFASPYTLNVLVKDRASADALAARLAALPTVARAMTISDLVPEDQENKRLMLDDIAFTLGPALDPPQTPQLDGNDIRQSAQRLQAKITQYLQQPRGSGALVNASADLAPALGRLIVTRNDQQIVAISQQLLGGFPSAHASLVNALEPSSVALANVPDDVKAGWIAQDGRYRVQLFPKVRGYDLNELMPFVRAVKSVAPDAVGPPSTIIESGRIVLSAFTTASALALVGTALLLWVMLRNAGDVLRTLAPLLLAFVWTMALCTLIGLPITFANIIGLPLLLGIGVTYPIYHVIAWRAGDEELLSSPMARGVFFSALTTMAAFGSLAVSHHPGTAGMGILLSIALTFALAATYLVLPALLGPAPPVSQRVAEGRYAHG
jgi:uncharacterized protein